MIPTQPKQQIEMNIDSVKLEGILRIPNEPLGIVLFVHGAGSSRLSPRNNYVAEILFKAKIATLLFDLLTEEEDQIYANRFDIKLLTKRLTGATKWVSQKSQTKNLFLGYFGASTGAAAAIFAAAALGKTIRAIVSRGGRPDLASNALFAVKAPTLLIVGQNDPDVLELNRQSLKKIKSIKKLVIIPNAGHLFEEEGALEQVANFAKDWFQKYL